MIFGPDIEQACNNKKTDESNSNGFLKSINLNWTVNNYVIFIYFKIADFLSSSNYQINVISVIVTCIVSVFPTPIGITLYKSYTINWGSRIPNNCIIKNYHSKDGRDHCDKRNDS